MKKIFTLLAATVLFVAANAQYRNNDQGQWANQNNGYEKNYPKNDRYDRDDRFKTNRRELERKRDWEIARINRDYDYKADAIRSNFFLGRFEKQRRLRFLEEQRERDIRKVYYDYKRYGLNDDRDDDHDRGHH